MKKIIYSSLFFAICFNVTNYSFSNHSSNKPTMTMPSLDSLPGDSSSLNFWKGKWKATWEENGKKEAYGRNTVSLEMNGKVIQESFSIHAGENKGFRGHSVSVFDTKVDRWKQTWVDTDGSYLDFTGYKKGDDFYFERAYTGKKGKLIRQRMRFYDIAGDRFIWDWEQSIDQGPWQLNWRIWYTRVL